MPASRKIKPRARTPIVLRVAEYVNTHFDGNMSAAAEAIGCRYDALRALANGLCVRVPMDVILLLSEHSGRDLNYWLKGLDSDGVPTT